MAGYFPSYSWIFLTKLFSFTNLDTGVKPNSEEKNSRSGSRNGIQIRLSVNWVNTYSWWTLMEEAIKAIRNFNVLH